MQIAPFAKHGTPNSTDTHFGQLFMVTICSKLLVSQTLDFCEVGSSEAYNQIGRYAVHIWTEKKLH